MSVLEEISFERGKNIINKQVDKLYGTLENVYHQKAPIDKLSTINPREFMETYTAIYNMCIQKENNFNESLYKDYHTIFDAYLRTTVYTALQSKKDNELLVELQKRWQNHKLMMRWMQRFFQYLDRFHVPHNGLQSLERTGYQLFEKSVVDRLGEAIIAAYLKELHKDRNEFQANRNAMKTAATIFVTLGSKDNWKLYDKLEYQLVEESEKFYKAKSMEWSKLSCSEYLENAEKLLLQENKRLEDVSYGNEHQQRTIKSILHKFNDRILKEYKTVLLEKETGFIFMVEHEQLSILQKIYRLYCRLEDKFEGIHQAFKAFLVKKSSNLVKFKKSELESKENNESQSKDNAFVESLIQFYENYNKMVEKCFSNDTYFDRAFKEALEESLNIPMKPSVAHFFAEFLEKLLDKSSGRNQSLNNDDIERIIDKVMKLFASLRDKDVFLAIYSSSLAKRLIHGTSANTETEQSVITKLKLCCGTEFTKKIEGMLSDIQIAIDEQKSLEQYIKAQFPLFPSTEFNIKALAKTNWSDFGTDRAIQIPREIKFLIDGFESFYFGANPKKSLEWIYSASDIIISTKFSGIKKELQMNFYQYTILNLYENTDELAFEDILQRTGLDEDTARKNIAPMTFVKQETNALFVKASEGTTISKSGVFHLNMKFGPKQLRVVIPAPKKQEDTMKIENKVQEERHLAVEAAIVRIMKSRKTLSFNEIIEQVCQILRQFSPEVKFIKKKIEDLIEKEYLKRDTTDQKMFHYLA